MKKNNVEVSVWKFLFTFSTGQKVFVKVGNGFDKRVNKVSIILNNNRSLIYKNENNLKKKTPTPMETLLLDFHKSFLNKSCYNKDSFDITKKVSNLLLNKLKITR